jgi:sulfur-oxidizing protein SoxY
MGIVRNACLAAGLAMLPLLGQAHAEDSEAVQAARWHDVAAAIFNNRPVGDGSAILKLDVPPRALDAALVPVGISVARGAAPKALYLVVDDNPAPLAAGVHFGPLADPHVLKLRVRIDQYTLVHAVAEMQNGELRAVSAYVKAAGGCSAPGTDNAQEALARIGKMKLLATAAPPPGQPAALELLISHPNFNGMQMNPVTRYYTPARYVQTVAVSQAGKAVFTLDGDISLSQDPAITFALKNPSSAPLDVEVHDSARAVFKQRFPVPTGSAS